MYDNKDDIWILVREEGENLDISLIVHNLSALGYELYEGYELNISIENN